MAERCWEILPMLPCCFRAMLLMAMTRGRQQGQRPAPRRQASSGHTCHRQEPDRQQHQRRVSSCHAQPWQRRSLHRSSLDLQRTLSSRQRHRPECHCHQRPPAGGNATAAYGYGGGHSYTTWARAWVEGDDGSGDKSLSVLSSGLSTATVKNGGSTSNNAVLLSIGV